MKLNDQIILERSRFFNGPNVYALFPVMEGILDLGGFADRHSNAAIKDKLVELLPVIKEHHCSQGHQEGYSGGHHGGVSGEHQEGFLECLDEGTDPTHIIEHICIAIQKTCGSQVKFGKSHELEGTRCRVVVEYADEELALESLGIAIDTVNCLFSERPVPDV